MVGRCIPYWNGHFLRDMLVFRGVGIKFWLPHSAPQPDQHDLKFKTFSKSTSDVKSSLNLTLPKTNSKFAPEK